MIRQGKLSDIPRILNITIACADAMIKNKVFQWNEFYPNKKAFLTDVERNELYVIEIENEIMGCITVSTFKDEEYDTVSWLTPDRSNIYIHRLAVHPSEQGKGYAQRLMSFAEKYAQKHKMISVRLDTFSQNTKNINFYEQRGYKRLGSIFFPKQSEFPFYCYEFIL